MLLTSQQHARVSQGRSCFIVRAATLRQKLPIKLSISPRRSILTTGQPDTALTLYLQAPGRVGQWITNLYVTGSTRPRERSTLKAGVKARPAFLDAVALTTRPTRPSGKASAVRTGDTGIESHSHPSPLYPPHCLVESVTSLTPYTSTFTYPVVWLTAGAPLEISSCCSCSCCSWSCCSCSSCYCCCCCSSSSSSSSSSFSCCCCSSSSSSSFSCCCCCCCCFSSSSAFPARSVGFTILGEISSFVTVFF